MNQEPLSQLASILQVFDNRADGFYLHDLSAAINSLAAQVRDSGRPVPIELAAEQIAIELVPDYRKDSPWGTYYGPVMEIAGTTIPDIRSITEEVLNYWVTRARQATHPILRIRYADVAWDLSRGIAQARCSHEIPKIMINATIDLVARKLTPHQVDGLRYLRRAMAVAIRLNDSSAVEGLRDAIISFEDQIAVDHLPGLWGFSFDILIAENKKVPLQAEQRQKLVADLEARLTRLTTVLDAEKIDPHHVEGAAMRLAHYYRRNDQRDAVRRILVIFANACIRKSQESKTFPAAAGWLQRIHEALLSFGLNDEAKALQPHYLQAAQALHDQMLPIEVNLPIDTTELETYIAGFTSGASHEILERLVFHYLLRREEEQKRLEDVMEGRVFLRLFTSTLVDRTGRAISQIGPLESDPEGNLIRHVANTMDYGALFLRSVIDRLVSTQKINSACVMDYLKKSDIFPPDRDRVITSALDAYFSQNWLVAIHLLVPQIEHVIRYFVGITGGSTMKTKGKNGGLLLRNLDELLLDERVVCVYGLDVTFYLRVLLTDQRGWNLRNDVAHGILPPDRFNPRTADRLFHAILLVGSIRRKPKDGDAHQAEAPE